ncbi:MAG: HAMP domain-containing histidine kinase [Sphingobacteriales bacterium]|nr:MAG: HAMP domain-containing histidine kinase [Sphingobacteriales bacterium]
MKLLNKITLWFIGIILLVTPVTMYISYNNIKTRIDRAEVERMTDVNTKVADQLRSGETPEKYAQGRPILISTITDPLPEKRVTTQEACSYNTDLQRKECKLTVSSYYNINGKNYKISSYNYVSKSDQILSGMLNALIWKLILIITSVSITAGLLSRHILSPLYKTMDVIHNFNLKQKQRIQLPKANTKEFQELNVFLKKMTDKAMDDYLSVKEFSENASHELQTPLAVIRTKIELLSETDIDGQQANLIADMQTAIEKLSRINRSLTLLTKLENQEFATTDDIRFCRLVCETVEMYTDMTALRDITVTASYDKQIMLNMHPALGEMLVNNLVSNAIRHNIEGGSIDISLTKDRLYIANTGLPPEIPTEELFLRFKKSNQSADGIGLGLAIVKQICDVSHYPICYDYCDGWHKVTVKLNKEIPGMLPVQPLKTAQQPALA